jgi:uncharacterized protein (TIGR03067 family)
MIAFRTIRYDWEKAVANRVLALIVAVLLIGAEPPRRDDAIASDDQEAMQGRWKIVKAMRGNNEMPAAERDGIKLTIKDNKFEIAENGHNDTAEFKLDPSMNPRTINLRPQGQPETLGIYEIDGDSMKICFARDGGKRPTKFDSPRDTDITLLILKREK